MTKPRALVPGARIAVFSAASPFPIEELEAGMAELRALGFEPIVDPRVLDRSGYVSGPATVRAAVINDALADDGIDALMGARGGYGSVHVLPLLDPERVSTARKPIIGYSDLTSLLQFVALDCGLVAFHGPTVTGRLSGGPARYDAASLLGLLTRAEPFGEMAPEGLNVLRAGEAAGTLLGGTLTQVCASLGTPFAFAPPPGFVFLIEEINERPYRLDRMLTQVRLAGILDRAAAIVVGQLPGCDEPAGTPTARGVLAELFREFEGPVLLGFPTGHTAGPAWTLPLGVRVRVLATDRPRVVIEEAAVA